MLKLLNGRLKISLLLLPAAAAMIYFSGPALFGAFFLALFIHECAHALIARAVGARIMSMELLPFGCAINMDGFFDSGAKEAAVAAAGPLINIAAAAGANLLFPNDVFSEVFVSSNASLAAVNMMPVLPMDGGRIFCAVLGLAIKKQTAVKISGCLGIAAGTGACVLFILLAANGSINISVGVTGFFMLYSAVKSIKSAGFEFARRTEEKRKFLNSRTAIEVKHIAARDSRPLCEVMLSLDPRKYNVIHVLDSRFRTVKTLDETAVLERMLAGRSDEPIGKGRD